MQQWAFEKLPVWYTYDGLLVKKSYDAQWLKNRFRFAIFSTLQIWSKNLISVHTAITEKNHFVQKQSFADVLQNRCY